jgi:hypothetical protein
MALAACACNQSRPAAQTRRDPAPQAATRHVPVRSVRFDAASVPQAERLKWNRPGSWRAVAIVPFDGPPRPALYADDRYSARILLASPRAGFDVYPARLDCKAGGASIHAGRHYEDAVGLAHKDLGRPPFHLGDGEVARLCRSGRDGGFRGDTAAAAQMVREAHLETGRPAGPPPAGLPMIEIKDPPVQQPPARPKGGR